MATLPAPRNPSRPRGAARREALLVATLRLVGEVGADVITHRRVAEAAGLPLASTTYWFESKEHLLTAALQFAAERDLTRLRESAAPLIADPAAVVTVADVVAVLTTPDGNADADPSGSRGRSSLMTTYTLMLEAARRPALQELSERWTDAYLETIGSLMARAGSRRPADDARLLLAAHDGLTIDRLASGTHHAFDPRPELERLAASLVGATASGEPR